jgi:phosphoribosylglycinamide formyltransferase 2
MPARSRNKIEKILLLGSGELGKELVISLKRLGKTVIAVDRYAGAPAMQVADGFAVISMLDGDALEQVVAKHKPDLIVPEIEAIRTEKLREFESRGIFVAPTAEAAHLTMNRDAIREVAAKELKLRTARYGYAETLEEMCALVKRVGLPCVIKPIMSSSGKGQSTVRRAEDIEAAWHYAVSNMRGDVAKVIVEEFIKFELEITLLTVREENGKVHFVKPIGHRQKSGDYRESWLPARISPKALKKAESMAKKVVARLGGAGIFGVEFFVTKKEVIFSELSPRPHDTGMVTLFSQDFSEFDLHARAILGLPIPKISYQRATASAVCLADRDSTQFKISGLNEALKLTGTDVRIFGKPETRKNRRMGVALARGKDEKSARALAVKAASRIKIDYK